MTHIRCLIVDDEPVARKVLREFIERVPFLTACGQCENAMKAEAFLRNNEVDLVLLDIEMPKLSGLDWLKQAAVRPAVILTTAFPNYALEGYELEVMDYLLKPIAFERFLKAVQKVKDYAELKDHRATGNGYIFVRSDKRIEKVDLNAILFAESVGNYVSIVTTEKKLLAYLTLKSLESQLPAQDFVRIHQSYLINFSQIQAVEGNQAVVGGQSLPVSRQFRNVFLQRVENSLLKR